MKGGRCFFLLFSICRNYSISAIIVDRIRLSTIHKASSPPARIRTLLKREAREGFMAEAQAKKMGLVQWLLIGIVVAEDCTCFSPAEGETIETKRAGIAAAISALFSHRAESIYLASVDGGEALQSGRVPVPARRPPQRVKIPPSRRNDLPDGEFPLLAKFVPYLHGRYIQILKDVSVLSTGCPQE
jgi:hypothetical protein